MIHKLLEIMTQLRDPDTGCPWDKQQTYRSIVPHTLEEAYEVAEVIEQDRLHDLPDELGDLLFQVVFYAEIARQEGRFEFSDVVNAICEKLIRRHPHVFAEKKISSVEEQNKDWEKHKAQERLSKTQQHSATNVDNRSSVLDNINRALPALSQAEKMQRRVSNIGFDWPDISGVIEKVKEELTEVTEEILIEKQSQQNSRIEEEIGDLLFACVNLARHANVNAEAALRNANRKFETRFRQVEAILTETNSNVADASLNEMDAAWNKIKSLEKKGNQNPLKRS